MTSPEQLFAEQAVAGLLQEGPRPTPYSTLTSAEVVELAGEGPGIALLWEQRRADCGSYTFGLLMSVSALIADQVERYAGEATVETCCFSLRLAVDEPHAGVEGVRTWLRAVP